MTTKTTQEVDVSAREATAVTYVIWDGRRVLLGPVLAQKVRRSSKGRRLAHRERNGQGRKTLLVVGRNREAALPTPMPNPMPAPTNGAELVDYWRKIGVIGTRKDIPSATAEARRLRDQAEAVRRR